MRWVLKNKWIVRTCMCLIIWLYIHIGHVKVITLSNLKKKEIEEGKERGQVRDH